MENLVKITATQLKTLKKKCLRNSENSVERISVCNVTENLMEQAYSVSSVELNDISKASLVT